MSLKLGCLRNNQRGGSSGCLRPSRRGLADNQTELIFTECRKFFMIILHCCHPPTKLRKGHVFSRVCLSSSFQLKSISPVKHTKGKATDKSGVHITFLSKFQTEWHNFTNIYRNNTFILQTVMPKTNWTECWQSSWIPFDFLLGKLRRSDKKWLFEESFQQYSRSYIIYSLLSVV